MKYSEFIFSNNSFQSSVNLQYDLNKEQKLNSYIPTQQSISILKRYLNAVYNDNYNEDNATVLIGPYGRGKSHLLLILAALISCGMGNISESAIDNLINKLSVTEKTTGELANLIKTKNKPFLPVIINSNHTDINQSFIIALRDALDRNSLNNFFPETYFDSAIKMIETWENDFENAIKLFKKELKNEKIKINDLKEALHKCSPSAYQTFCKVYPLVSNGAEFNPMQNTDIVKMYEKVSDALIEQKGYSGIYIIFDEFSKFLESSAVTKDMQNLKLIQDFAELAVRENKLHICCITHKEILDYSQNDSFRTVDGRFKKVYFVASAEQSYELVANAICHTEKFDKFYTKHADEFNNINQLCHLTGLFNDLSDKAYNKILIKDCFPLHPISVYALIKISEAVGQNERTLFTFLSQVEEYSLQSFLDKSIRKTDFLLLTIDWIFDYFSELFRVEVFNSKIHSIWSKTKSAIKKCENTEQVKMVKILAMRKGIIPLYIAFAMRKKQDVIVISYKNKEVLLTGDVLSQIEDSPSDYSFYTEKGTKEKYEYVDFVISLFGTENDEVLGNKCSFDVETMQKWFRGLSKFARDHVRTYKDSEITDVKKKFLSFKQQLLKYDINPHSFMFNDIPEYFECENNYIETAKKLKLFAESYNSFILDTKTYIIEKVSASFNSTINGSLCSIMNDWYEVLPNETKNHVFSSDVNTFIHFIRENTSFDDVEVISKLAKSMTMLAIEDELLKRKYKDYFFLDVDYRPMKKAYSDDGFWAVLNLMDFSEGLRINSTYYNNIMLYVYAYTLLSAWDKIYPTEQEITIDQIVMNLKWNKRFGFDDDEMMYALEKMEETSILRLNKQLMPVTVIRTTNTASLLPYLYDYLN